MTSLAIHRAPTPPTNAIALPEPRVGPITIRKAVLEGADFMFIDGLQKKHSNMVGFMPKDQLEKNIIAGKVLVAQDPATTLRIGYCIFNDKYFKREDLGIVYQLNIVPDKQRGLVGAALVKAAFEACPWGVKLFCCWCAQDLAANHFWESISFVPIAFRAGSRGKAQGGKRKEGRMQIMWQRRIRENDCGDGATPYWYPTETSGGAMKENRIVLPIPMGKHWSDELPFVLPGASHLPPPKGEGSGVRVDARVLARSAHPHPGPLAEGEGVRQPRTRKAKAAATNTPPPPARPKRGLWFAAPTSPVTSLPQSAADEAVDSKSLVVAGKPKRPPKQRNDPKHIAFARELRDRFMDEVSSGSLLLSSESKYDVSRQLPAATTPTAPTAIDESSVPMLEHRIAA